MEPVQTADAKDMLEKAISDGRALAEQSANYKVVDFPYQKSPKHSPSLVPLILQTEVGKDDDLLIEMKTTDCIFNFEDIFEDEIEERKEAANENINECNRGKRVDLDLTDSVIIEEPDFFIEGKNTKPEGIIKDKKQKENEVQGGSDIAINVAKKKRNSNEEIKGKSSTGKNNRREKGRKSKEGRTKEGKTKEEGLKDNKVKDESSNKLEKEVDVSVDLAFTAKDLTAQVERIIFTSISGILKVLISKLVVIFLEKCLLNSMPTPKKKEVLLEDVVEGSMQKMKESMNKDINNENKLSYLEKEIRKEKLSNKEKPIKEKYLEKVLTTDRPTEERIEKGKKGKSSKRKGKKSKDAGRKMPPLPSSQSIDQQNNLEKNETNEDLLTSPCSTVSSPPALPPSCSSSTSFPQALVRRGEQSARQNSSSIGRMVCFLI